MTSSAFFYGKLPNFSDFVRHNASGAEVRALDRWIQEGLYAAAHHFDRGWNEAYERTPAYRFVFSPDDSAHFLIGVLQPSRDRSERKYPFCVALTRGKNIYESKSSPLVPMIFSSFFKESQKIIQLGLQGFSLSDLAERVDCLEDALEENASASQWSFKEYLSKTTQEKFWTGLFGDFDDPRKYLIIYNLLELFQPNSPGTSRSLKIGIRFPLNSQGYSFIPEVCFWSQFCSSLLSILIYFGQTRGEMERIFSSFFWGRFRPGVSFYLSIPMPRMTPSASWMTRERRHWPGRTAEFLPNTARFWRERNPPWPMS
jgi:type VI secretion system ImpM family protein